VVGFAGVNILIACLQLVIDEGHMMAGIRTDSGKRLSRRWKLGAKHALFRKDGTWYHILQDFPGAPFDYKGSCSSIVETSF
jgi:hypothetical protein